MLFGLPSSLLAQDTDSIPWSVQVDLLEIHAVRGEGLSAGQQVQSLDSALLSRYALHSLSDLLSIESHLFIKNYGPGGIATLSGRGGSASQTAIVWEGLPLQNPMLGQTDLSLLPAFWIDQATIQYSGSSTLWGGGAPNGAVHLRQVAPYGRGWRMRGATQGGSFGTFQQQAQLQYGARNWAISSRVYYLTAQNNFPFRHPNLIGKPLVRQTNAEQEQMGFLQELYLRPHRHHQLHIKAWGQHSLRHIPPTLLQTTANDRQLDQTLRLLALWQYSRERFGMLVRTAHVRERLDYRSSSVQSNSHTEQWLAESEQRWTFSPQHQLQIGEHYTFYHARSAGYASPAEQHRAALWAAYRYSGRSRQAQAGLRAELVDGRLLSPSFSLGAEQRFFPWWQLRLHGSHNYRLPTLNDRYWTPGGNPELRPEYSWNIEIGNQFNYKGLLFKLGAYAQWLRDQILWLPVGGTGLWSPRNEPLVRAWGIETQLRYTVQPHPHWALLIDARYTFASTKNDGGFQLLYTPQHNAALQLRLHYRGAYLQYQHLFVGPRSITMDNSEWLPWYQVGNLELGYALPQAGFVFVRCSNMGNTAYEVVSQRRMPGRAVMVGLVFTY